MQLLRVNRAGDVNYLAFSPDGRLLAVATEQCNVRLLEVPDGKVARNLSGTKGAELHFTPDGGLLTRFFDVLLWPADRGSPRTLAPSPIGGSGRELAVSPDGTRFARVDRTQTAMGPLTCRAVPTGDVIWQDEWPREISPTLLFSPDSRHLAVLYTRCVELRDASTGYLHQTFGPYPPQSPTQSDKFDQDYPSAAFRPDGLALVGRWSHRLDVLNPATGDVVARLDPEEWSDCPVAFSADSRLLAASTWDGNVRFWDALTWKPLRGFEPGIGRINALAFSPDGMLVAFGGEKGQVALLDLVDVGTDFLGHSA
jgi:WD40 repeat protein